MTVKLTSLSQGQYTNRRKLPGTHRHPFSGAFVTEYCCCLPGASSLDSRSSKRKKGFIRKHDLNRMIQEAYLPLSKGINCLGYIGREKKDNWSGLHISNKSVTPNA